MNFISIKVDTLAGVMDATAAGGLCCLAEKLGVRVETEFNGITMFAMPGDNWQNVIARYDATKDRAMKDNEQ